MGWGTPPAGKPQSWRLFGHPAVVAEMHVIDILWCSCCHKARDPVCVPLGAAGGVTGSGCCSSSLGGQQQASGCATPTAAAGPFLSAAPFHPVRGQEPIPCSTARLQQLGSFCPGRARPHHHHLLTQNIRIICVCCILYHLHVNFCAWRTASLTKQVVILCFYTILPGKPLTLASGWPACSSVLAI